MRYRSRMDIIAMVLKASDLGATRTHIMYDAYLSYSQVKEYLAFLLERGLLTFDETTSLYTPTEKGRGLLVTYEGISDLISVNGMSPGKKDSAGARQAQYTPPPPAS